MSIRRAICAALLAVLATAPLSAAYAEGVWSPPGGVFTITFPTSWGVVEAPANRPPAVLAHFGQTTMLVERKECFVDRVPVPSLANLDQAAVNEAVAGWDQDEVLRRVNGANVPSLRVVTYEGAEVDGVRVITFNSEIRMRDRDLRIFQRVFVVTRAGVAVQYGVNCYAMDQGASIADINELLGSLQINTDRP